MIRIPVEDVKRLGRATQGVIVMRLRGDERVSAIAPVVEGESDAEGESREPIVGSSSVESGAAGENSDAEAPIEAEHEGPRNRLVQERAQYTGRGIRID